MFLKILPQTISFVNFSNFIQNVIHQFLLKENGN